MGAQNHLSLTRKWFFPANAVVDVCRIWTGRNLQELVVVSYISDCPQLVGTLAGFVSLRFSGMMASNSAEVEKTFYRVPQAVCLARQCFRLIHTLQI